jgi:hypothetical protein
MMMRCTRFIVMWDKMCFVSIPVICQCYPVRHPPNSILTKSLGILERTKISVSYNLNINTYLSHHEKLLFLQPENWFFLEPPFEFYLHAPKFLSPMIGASVFSQTNTNIPSICSPCCY